MVLLRKLLAMKNSEIVWIQEFMTFTVKNHTDSTDFQSYVSRNPIKLTNGTYRRSTIGYEYLTSITTEQLC